MKADKALVVVVCPPLAARFQGKGGIQYKLHANDRVVAVNTMGTYSFAYLDPGDYLLVSQTETANGFHINLEAGKDYYFLQDTFMGLEASLNPYQTFEGIGDVRTRRRLSCRMENQMRGVR